MNRMRVNLLVAALMVVGIGGFVFAQKQAGPAATDGAATATSSAAVTLEEIATHNTRESCWTMINGNAYDLTSWIPQHPGGEAGILKLCGVDGSAIFTGQHGGSATQESILAGFKIGGGGGATGAGGAVAPAPAPVPAGEVDDRGRGRGRGGDDNNDDS